MDFGSGFRFGMPFFLPIDYYDTRIQMLDNVSIAKGDHLIKFGAEWNSVNSVQTFLGFANSRYIFGSVTAFLNYLTDSTTGGPLLYLQQAGIDRSVRAAGTRSEEHTSELQSRLHLVCRLLLEKKKKKIHI